MLIRDDFEDARSPGTVIGTGSSSGSSSGSSLGSSSGAHRQGVDAEKTLSIDNSALRISPLITPGWGRSGIAYGPFKRQPGLALGVFLLNGHNASEGNSIEETLKGRFFRWLRGSETHAIPHRLKHWVTSQHHQHRAWHFYRWLRNHKKRFKKDSHIKENLAIGWFDSAIPAEPTEGNALVVRTAGPENGELCAGVNGQLLPALRGLQNLQTYYIVVLREQGAAYYAAALPNAYGLSAYPYMRLVGIDTCAAGESVYAGIYQAALGQVGFRVDSRVYSTRAAVLPTLSNWYGTAHMADALVGEGALENSATETGQVWRSPFGGHQRTTSGTISTSDYSISILNTREPVGALHVSIAIGNQASDCAIFWRTQNEQNTWALFLTDTQCALKLCEKGAWIVVATENKAALKPSACVAIQILDTGDFFSLYISGTLLFNQWFTDKKFSHEQGIGLLSGCPPTASSPLRFQCVEAHPRAISIPVELRMAVPWERKGAQTSLVDRFGGSAGEALEQKANEMAQQRWEKTIGKGSMLLTGQNAVRVKASSEIPNSGRLAYTLPWQHPSFADISVDILSPGQKRYEGEKGRGGLIFWQDADNYMIVNHWLDDTFDGSAMSVFLTVDGYEEIYDGVWANLGERIVWGEKRQHRVVFDGLDFAVYVGKEPVLYRSIRDVYPKMPPLKIRRVGIVANWEWGDDTGSEFSNFVALF